MRNRVNVGALCVTLLVALVVSARLAEARQASEELPSAASVLDRFIEVSGGRAAYEDLTSQIARGTMEMTGGISGAVTIYMREPGLSYVSIELAGLGLIESGVKDGVAWENSVLQGPRIKTGAERAQALREGMLNAPLYWRDMYPQVEVTGIESVNGEPAYVVVMTPEEGGPQTTYYSVDSGLALRTRARAASPMGEIPIEITLSDYKEFGGILSPATITQSLAGQTVTIRVESTEQNAEIPAERFELPSAVQSLVE